MGLAHKSRSAPAWSTSLQVPTCKDASLRSMGTILSPSARVTLKILWKVCNFLWFSNWGNQPWGLKNTSNHHADSYSHSAYRSTSYEITPWLPRRNWAGFLNWGLARRSTFHVRLMEVVDDRRWLVSGIHTTAGTHPGITVTPTGYQMPQQSRQWSKSWTSIVIKQKIRTERARRRWQPFFWLLWPYPTDCYWKLLSLPTQRWWNNYGERFINRPILNWHLPFSVPPDINTLPKGCVGQSLSSPFSSLSCNLPFVKSRVCVHARMLSRFSHVRLFATLCTVARQAPLSMEFSSQEYWSGLPFPPPGDLPNPGIEPESPVAPALQADSLSLSHREILSEMWKMFSPGYPCHVCNKTRARVFLKHWLYAIEFISSFIVGNTLPALSHWILNINPKSLLTAWSQT